MNENIDLTKILKDCPNGTKFYTSMSEIMKIGIGYAPKNGVCLFCKQQIYAPTGMEYASIYRPTGRYVEGISIAKAREEITTSCPFCRNSFTEINVDKLYDW